ncbi:flagellar hook assembly protein FlgD [Acidisarcina polymorpha]|nr:flagellar hook capping FlgD N-terminal domain-containing protein [Acidisarcina polymorpha]
MQTLSDFKQNLHNQAHPVINQQTRPQPASRVSASASSAKPAAAASGSNSGSDSTTITANDFLQLLVAEMKNQDPTSDQDPNAYINQLVQVNSLQQLISINQDLTPASTTPSSPTPGIAPGPQLGSAAGSQAASIASSMVPTRPIKLPLQTRSHPGPGPIRLTLSPRIPIFPLQGFRKESVESKSSRCSSRRQGNNPGNRTAAHRRTARYPEEPCHPFRSL